MVRRKTKWIAAALALFFVLLILGWRLGWFADEPTYQGKTVTQWLDTVVLYDRETNACGVYMTLRSSDQLAEQDGFKAVMSIGPQAAPILVQRVMDLPEQEKQPALLPRWKAYWRQKLEQVRTGRKAMQKKSTTYPSWQRERKAAAGLLLVALGTNAQAGFDRYLDAYATASKPRVTGPLLGVFPGDIARAGAGLSPGRKAEVLTAITAGMQHTNGEVRRAAANAARSFPEEGLGWKPLFLLLTQDTDQYAPQEALLALMRIPPDEDTRRLVENITQDPAKSERVKEIASTVIREWDRVRSRVDPPK